jgi:hypothetical protein
MDNNTKQVYKSQLSSVIECIKSPLAREKSLEALLSLCNSEELIDIFIELELPKIMIRCLENEDIKEKELILKILINISGIEKYIKSFIEINVFHRLLSIIFKIIKNNYDTNDNNNKDKTYDNVDDLILDTLDMNSQNLNNNNNNNISFDVKMVFDKYELHNINLIKGFENETYLNLYFIILSNLTSFDVCKEYFLDLNNSNKNVHGILFFKLLDKYFENIQNNSFNFCSSLISNVTSIKEGRILILENKIFKIFLILFEKMNKMKIINNLRLIRNCVFEYEKFIDEILIKDGILINFLEKILLLNNNYDNKNIFDNLNNINFNEFENEINNNNNNEEKEIINELIMDIFLILSNNNKSVNEMKNKNLLKIIENLEEKLKDIKNNNENLENMKDRLMVLKDILNK